MIKAKNEIGSKLEKETEVEQWRCLKFRIRRSVQKYSK